MTHTLDSALVPIPAFVPRDLGHLIPHHRTLVEGRSGSVEHPQAKNQRQPSLYTRDQFSPVVQGEAEVNHELRTHQNLAHDPSAEESKGSSEPSAARNHGSLFEALLQVANASSTETSPEVSSNERSKSISSSSTISCNEGGDLDVHASDQQGEV